MNNLGAGKADINPGNQNQLHFRYVENWQRVETFSVTWIVLIIPVQFFFFSVFEKEIENVNETYLLFFFFKPISFLCRNFLLEKAGDWKFCVLFLYV